MREVLKEYGFRSTRKSWVFNYCREGEELRVWDLEILSDSEFVLYRRDNRIGERVLIFNSKIELFVYLSKNM